MKYSQSGGTEMDIRDLIKLFSEEIKDENIRYLINSFLIGVDNIETVDKAYVLDFIRSKANTINTVKFYKNWLDIMFDILVSKRFVHKNPMDEINDSDLNELFDSVLDKKTFITQAELLKIVDEYMQVNKVRALCAYALFEGIKNDELAYIEKTEIDGNVIHIKGRNEPFIMDKRLKQLMDEIKDSDYVTIQRNGFEYKKEFVNSKYIIRSLAGKRTVDDQIKVLRSKTNYIRKEYGLNTKQIYESGFIHYAKQQNVTSERFKWLLKKYNIRTSDAYILLAKGI